jgi:putative PEP-CTERM system histidine kinase
VLLLREAEGLHWAGSWNLPDGPPALPDGAALTAALRDGAWVAELRPGTAAGLTAAFGPLWLAVPLAHPREGLLGAVLLAPPRAPFPLDAEVFALLRMLGREVAMFLAERRAAEHLADQRQLQDYARRFAFVAHDVKTVASQLGLLLDNAEENIGDPEFQRDMLLTVRASADRINTLIARLRQSGEEPTGPALVAPLARLRRIASQRPAVELEADGQRPLLVAMPPERFEAAVTHLLDNAVEASAPGAPVRLRLQHDAEAGRVTLEIADSGPGMTPDFIRDELFRPLATSKPRGNGIGAWQARELLREAGGDLAVLSRPGAGTTMRLTLPARQAEGAASLEMRA